MPLEKAWVGWRMSDLFSFWKLDCAFSSRSGFHVKLKGQLECCIGGVSCGGDTVSESGTGKSSRRKELGKRARESELCLYFVEYRSQRLNRKVSDKPVESNQGSRYLHAGSKLALGGFASPKLEVVKAGWRLQ